MRSFPANDPETLLDQLLSEFDFESHHAIVIAAPLVRVAEAVETYSVDTDGSLVVRLLVWLRGLGRAPGPFRTWAIDNGFTVLAEKPGEEIVLGIAGRFWALDELGNLHSLHDARAFVEFNQPGWAKAVINIRCEALSERTTRLSTATRVQCMDAVAYRWFALYWALIKPFSAWIRRDMLCAIERRALRVEG